MSVSTSAAPSLTNIAPTSDLPLAMLRAQADRATRLKAAHDVIDNSGSPEAARRQVAQFHGRYLELAAQRT